MQARGAGESARSLKVNGEEIWGWLRWLVVRTMRHAELAYLIWCITYADIEVLETLHGQHCLSAA